MLFLNLFIVAGVFEGLRIIREEIWDLQTKVDIIEVSNMQVSALDTFKNFWPLRS